MSSRRLIVTTSWDDGHPADRRLGELLAKYGIAATFYVPRSNCEGREVMGIQDLISLAENFEIAGHTKDHVVLTGLDRQRANQQILEGKKWLEDVIGGEVRGFCYPRGQYDETIKKMTIAAGFEYARTSKNFCSNVGRKFFERPTTLQFFPHEASVYLRNWIKYRPNHDRTRLLIAAITAEGLIDRVIRLFTQCAERGSYFHLWGHSWEIEEYGLWEQVEIVLKQLSTLSGDAEFVNNRQAFLSGADGKRPPTRRAIPAPLIP